MNFVKFANPHATSPCFTETTPVNRAQLWDDNEASVDLATHFEKERNILHEIVSSAIEVSGPHPKKSKKRKRIVTETEGEAELFRLFEGSPKPIVLSVTPYQGHLLERPSEDTSDEAHLRHLRAQDTAVDFDWLQSQAKIPWPSTRRESVSSRNFCTQSSINCSGNQSPTIALLERDLLKVATTVNTEFITAPSHPDPYCTKLLVVEKSDLAISPSPRLRESAVHKRSRPTFFRPHSSLGGKTRGYALGYPNSRSRPNPPSRYQRDRMTKAMYPEGVNPWNETISITKKHGLRRQTRPFN